MSNIRTEIIAGFVTFTTMAYAICVQPAIMSGTMPGMTPTGMDMNALVTTTCIAAALSCFVMGFWAQYPIALAPGMGMNFLLVLSVMPACAQALGSHVGAEAVWRLALGTIFVSGAIFVLLASLNMCSAMVNIISPSMVNAMAVALGMFIAFFGMKNGGLINAGSRRLRNWSDFRVCTAVLESPRRSFDFDYYFLFRRIPISSDFFFQRDYWNAS